MKTKRVVLIVIAILALIAGYMLSSHAQEVGWDTDEEPQRIQQKQWNQAIEGGADETEATGVPTPVRETAGEEKLEKFQAVSTGYIRREYTIHQDNLAGKWEGANIFPVSNSEPRWPSITVDQYNEALKSGIVDGRLKGTVYGPYYENMKRICGTAPGAKQTHVKAPAGATEWRMAQKMQRPYTLYRELNFECLAKTE